MDGSALPRFKRAYIAALQRRGVENVSYQSPMQPEDMNGVDGSKLACWFDDNATCELTIEVLVGANNVWIDETWDIPFCVQALGADTDDTQEILDQRAVELLADCIYVLVTDPDLDISQSDVNVQTFSAVPVGSSLWAGGVLPPNMRAVRHELHIELHARLKLGA